MEFQHTFDFEVKTVFGALTAFPFKVVCDLDVTGEWKIGGDEDGAFLDFAIKKEIKCVTVFLGKTEIDDITFRADLNCEFDGWLTRAVDKLTCEEMKIFEADLKDEAEEPVFE